MRASALGLALLSLALPACQSRPAAPVLCETDATGACICVDGFDGVVCGDAIDDDCDGADEACPTTSPVDVDVPYWGCLDESPPANVLAWALFEDGGTYYRPNACFVFFEGAKDEFYVHRVNLFPLAGKSTCDTEEGCICPSLDDWPSYDHRLYAFTTVPDPGACPSVAMFDDGGADQPVSNACRKYLLPLHRFVYEYSFVASGEAELRNRLGLFPQVEIACVEDKPHDNLPFSSLLHAPVRFNPGFEAKD